MSLKYYARRALVGVIAAGMSIVAEAALRLASVAGVGAVAFLLQLGWLP